ncbi:MAG TPA: glutamate synthase subunit beta [Bacteroidetes bacterium]|nr:glutamate synthase subunit beta [Bacteroidota bacterium]
MGDPKGFINISRKEAGYRPVNERIADFSEVEQVLNTRDRILQASRCMACGVPFCHWACSTHSRIPEWQDALYREQWEKAINLLHLTNDLPEITGRVCPALCEKACVLAIYEEPVTIRENEVALAEMAFKMGLIKPYLPKRRTGRKVAVIGSGPAGLTVASRLNRTGHEVTVFEKDENPGGLLRFGIPDFKLTKAVIDRRIDIYKKEGVIFRTGIYAGKDISARKLLETFDALCLAVGSREPRDLDVPGRDLPGIWFAMDFLSQQNRINAGANIPGRKRISAKGKHVIVIGGGDTGSDCVGTAIRQRARSVTQVEILPEPPLQRPEDNPWPYWPNTLRTSSSHEEGCVRLWSLSTNRIIGKDGRIHKVEMSKLKWKRENGRMIPEETGEKLTLEADMIILAMGFLHPVKDKLLKDLPLTFDERENIRGAEKGAPIFTAGDAATGPSLVVKAIESGQNAARDIHEYLMKRNLK